MYERGIKKSEKEIQFFLIFMRAFKSHDYIPHRRLCTYLPPPESITKEIKIALS